MQGQWGWPTGGHGQLPSPDPVLTLRCPVHPRWPPAVAKGCCQLRPSACQSLSTPLCRGSVLTCCSAALCGPLQALGWLTRERGSWRWELLFAIADAPVGPAASPSWKQPPGRRELTHTIQPGVGGTAHPGAAGANPPESEGPSRLGSDFLWGTKDGGQGFNPAPL